MDFLALTNNVTFKTVGKVFCIGGHPVQALRADATATKDTVL